MNPAIKAQWLQALRSGEYEQEQGRLKSSTGFCCLGVLCDIAAKSGVGKWGDFEFLIVTPLGDVVDADSQVPPPTIRDWAGLSESNPVVDKERNLRIAILNDGDKSLFVRSHTFAEIADLIEAHL